jgi:hypothetical protein
MNLKELIQSMSEHIPEKTIQAKIDKITSDHRHTIADINSKYDEQAATLRHQIESQREHFELLCQDPNLIPATTFAPEQKEIEDETARELAERQTAFEKEMNRKNARHQAVVASLKSQIEAARLQQKQMEANLQAKQSDLQQKLIDERLSKASDAIGAACLQGGQQQANVDIEIATALRRLSLARLAFAKAPMRSREEREIQKFGQKLVLGAELLDQAFQDHCRYVTASPSQGRLSRNMIEAVESGRSSKRASLKPAFSMEIGRVGLLATPQFVPV